MTIQLLIYSIISHIAINCLIPIYAINRSTNFTAPCACGQLFHKIKVFSTDVSAYILYYKQVIYSSLLITMLLYPSNIHDKLSSNKRREYFKCKDYLIIY